MLKKLVLFLVLFSLAVFSGGNSFTQSFYAGQNFFNNFFAPVVIPGSVSNNNSVGFYLDFFNPFQENATFNVFIGGDNQVFSKGFNFSRNVTLKPFEHLRLNTTLSPEGVLNSGGYFLVVKLAKVGNATSNTSVLVYFLFENAAPKNFVDNYYTPVIENNENNLEIYVDFFNPFENVSNFSITTSNVEGSNTFQEQVFNVSLKFIQHADFSFNLIPIHQSHSITQNFEALVSVYDLTGKKLVARGLIPISGLALPSYSQKSVFHVVQESFSLWVLVLITILACFFLAFSLWDYFSKLKNLRKACDWLKKKIKAMVFFLWRACKSLFNDFWSVEVEYKTMKILVVLTVILLLLQSLNVIQVFSLWVLLAVLLVLGFLLAIEKG